MSLDVQECHWVLKWCRECVSNVFLSSPTPLVKRLCCSTCRLTLRLLKKAVEQHTFRSMGVETVLGQC